MYRTLLQAVFLRLHFAQLTLYIVYKDNKIVSYYLLFDDIELKHVEVSMLQI